LTWIRMTFVSSQERCGHLPCGCLQFWKI